MNRLFFLSIAAPIILSTALFAADDSSNDPKLDAPNFPYKTVKTKEGLVFRVPADMPIEVRDGLQVPVPFDEYIYGKLGSLESKLSRLDQRLLLLEEKVGRLAPLAGVPDMPASASSAAAPASASPAQTDTTGILKAGEK